MKIYEVKVYANRNKCWFLNGQRHREDGPAIEWPDGYKEWWLNGKLHREDGPAVEYTNGSKQWYLNGKRHRVDGPAIEFADGYKEWYINGKQYTEDEWLKKTKKTKSKSVVIGGKEVSEDTIKAALKEYFK